MYVTAKVVKQTVMTSVYGVTFVGARRQIQNQIEERLSNGEVRSFFHDKARISFVCLQCISTRLSDKLIIENKYFILSSRKACAC